MSNRVPHSRTLPRSGSRDGGRSVLLVGDAASTSQALQDASPTARIEVSRDWFDAIGHLTQRGYDAVIAPATPISRRPNAAIEALRSVAGSSRLVLLAQPTEEALCRRLLSTGCDEYLIWPATSADLAKALTPQETRIPPTSPTASPAIPAQTPNADRRTSPLTPPAPNVEHRPSNLSPPFSLAGLAVAEVFLECLEREPANAARAGLRELNARLPAGARFELANTGDPDPVTPSGMAVLSHLLRSSSAAGAGVLHLLLTKSLDESAATALLDQVAPQLARILELQDRHQRLQKLAITDDLTGLYNARYFKHFLERILERARQQMAPVTLLLFDIDGFKKYNDQFGHAAGDEILIQTGKMMRRCIRDHDLVARLGGDEFAVVFWEKEGPRQAIAKEGTSVSTVSGQRMQNAVQRIFERFQAMIASHDFQALGPTGRGQLTISGGLAVYPWDGTTAQAMIDAADHALMFGAKRSGKNTVHLVGREENGQSAQRSS